MKSYVIKVSPGYYQNFAVSDEDADKEKWDQTQYWSNIRKGNPDVHPTELKGKWYWDIYGPSDNPRRQRMPEQANSLKQAKEDAQLYLAREVDYEFSKKLEKERDERHRQSTKQAEADLARLRKRFGKMELEKKKPSGGSPAPAADAYSMPEYDTSWETFVASLDKEPTIISEDTFEGDWAMALDFYNGSPGDTVAIAYWKGGSAVSVQTGRTLEEAQGKAIDDAIETNYFEPPRVSETPSWVSDVKNPLPKIPSSVKTIHWDDIPGFYAEGNYGSHELDKKLGGSSVAKKLVKKAGEPTINLGMLDPEMRMQTIPQSEFLTDIWADDGAAQKVEKKLQLKEGSLSQKQLDNVAKAFRAATKKSLDARGLPNKFYVFRGGLPKGNKETPTAVSLAPQTALIFTGSKFEQDPDLHIYEISKDDVLLDVGAVLWGKSMDSMQRPTGGEWEHQEDELILRVGSLKKPRKIILPQTREFIGDLIHREHSKPSGGSTMAKQTTKETGPYRGYWEERVRDEVHDNKYQLKLLLQEEFGVDRGEGNKGYASLWVEDAARAVVDDLSDVDEDEAHTLMMTSSDDLSRDVIGPAYAEYFESDPASTIPDTVNSKEVAKRVEEFYADLPDAPMGSPAPKSPTVQRDSDLWNLAVAEAVRLEKIADELVEAAGVDNDDWGEWMDDNHPELRDALTNLEIVVYGPPTDDPSATVSEVKILIDHAKHFQSEDWVQPRSWHDFESDAPMGSPGASGSEEDKVINVDKTAFMRAFNNVASAAAKEDSRPILTNVQLTIKPPDKKNIYLSAADGFQLKRAKVPATFPADILKTVGNVKSPWAGNINIPAKETVKELKKLGKSQGDISLAWEGNNDRMSFGSGGKSFEAQLYPGSFPNIESLIPDPQSKTHDEFWKVEAESDDFAAFAGATEKLTKDKLKEIRKHIKEGKGKYSHYGYASGPTKKRGDEKARTDIGRIVVTDDGAVMLDKEFIWVAEDKDSRRGHHIDTGASVKLPGTVTGGLKERRIAVNPTLLSSISETGGRASGELIGFGTSQPVLYQTEPDELGLEWQNVAMPMFVHWGDPETEGDTAYFSDPDLLTHVVKDGKLDSLGRVEADPLYRLKHQIDRDGSYINMDGLSYADPTKEQFKNAEYGDSAGGYALLLPDSHIQSGADYSDDLKKVLGGAGPVVEPVDDDTPRIGAPDAAFHRFEGRLPKDGEFVKASEANLPEPTMAAIRELSDKGHDNIHAYNDDLVGVLLADFMPDGQTFREWIPNKKTTQLVYGKDSLRSVPDRIPKLYEQEGEGDAAQVYLKLFTPDSDKTIFITEMDSNSGIMFGYTEDANVPDSFEVGYFDLGELMSARGHLGLPIERDISFSRKDWATAKDDYFRERGGHGPQTHIFNKSLEKLAAAGAAHVPDKPDTLDTDVDRINYLAYNAQMLNEHVRKGDNPNATRDVYNAFLEERANLEHANTGPFGNREQFPAAVQQRRDADTRAIELGYPGVGYFENELKELSEYLTEGIARGSAFTEAEVNAPYTRVRNEWLKAYADFEKEQAKDLEAEDKDKDFEDTKKFNRAESEKRVANALKEWEEQGIHTDGSKTFVVDGDRGAENLVMMPDLLKAPGGKQFAENLAKWMSYPGLGKDISAKDLKDKTQAMQEMNRGEEKLKKEAKKTGSAFVRHSVLTPGLPDDDYDWENATDFGNAFGLKMKSDDDRPTLQVFDMVPLTGANQENRRNLLNVGPRRAAMWGLLRWMADNPEESSRPYVAGKKQHDLESEGWDWSKPKKGKYWLNRVGLDLFGVTHQDSPQNRKFVKAAGDTKLQGFGRAGAWNPISYLMFGYHKGSLQDEPGSRHDNYDFMPDSPDKGRDYRSRRIIRTDIAKKATATPWGGMIADLYSDKRYRGGKRYGVHIAVPEKRKGKNILSYADASIHTGLTSKGLIQTDRAIARLVNTSDAGFPHSPKDLKLGRDKWEKNPPKVRGEKPAPRLVSVDVSRSAQLVGMEAGATKETNPTTGKKNKPDTIDRLVSYAWYLLPNTVDVHYLDYLSTETPVAFLNKKGKTSGNRVAIMGTDEEREAVNKVIQENFTQREQKQMGNLVIEMVSSPGNTIGTYSKNHYPGGIDRVVVEPKALKLRDSQVHKKGPYKDETIADDTLTHELIHFLRHRDPDRKGAVKNVSGYRGVVDMDVEESMTDGETQIRVRREPPLVATGGYYQYLKEGQQDPVAHYKSPTQEGYTVNYEALTPKEVTKLKKRIKKYPTAQREEIEKAIDERKPIRRVGPVFDNDSQRKHYDRSLMAGRTMPPDKMAHVNVDGEWKRQSLEELNVTVPEKDTPFWNKVIRLELLGLGDEPEIRKAIKARGVTQKEIDREIESILKGKKGKAAVESVRAMYPHMNIARLKNKGRAELVDQFFLAELKDPDEKSPRRVFTQMYNPGAVESDRAEMIDELLPDHIEEDQSISLKEYKDGKPVPVKIPSSARPAKISSTGPARPKKKSRKVKGAKRGGKVKSYVDTKTKKTYKRRETGGMPTGTHFAKA